MKLGLSLPKRSPRFCTCPSPAAVSVPGPPADAGAAAIASLLICHTRGPGENKTPSASTMKTTETDEKRGSLACLLHNMLPSELKQRGNKRRMIAPSDQRHRKYSARGDDGRAACYNGTGVEGRGGGKEVKGSN